MLCMAGRMKGLTEGNGSINGKLDVILIARMQAAGRSGMTQSFITYPRLCGNLAGESSAHACSVPGIAAMTSSCLENTTCSSTTPGAATTGTCTQRHIKNMQPGKRGQRIRNGIANKTCIPHDCQQGHADLPLATKRSSSGRAGRSWVVRHAKIRMVGVCFEELPSIWRRVRRKLRNGDSPDPAANRTSGTEATALWEGRLKFNDVETPTMTWLLLVVLVVYELVVVVMEVLVGVMGEAWPRPRGRRVQVSNGWARTAATAEWDHLCNQANCNGIEMRI